jgi:hypothetical protein
MTNSWPPPPASRKRQRGHAAAMADAGDQQESLKSAQDGIHDQHRMLPDSLSRVPAGRLHITKFVTAKNLTFPWRGRRRAKLALGSARRRAKRDPRRGGVTVHPHGLSVRPCSRLTPPRRLGRSVASSIAPTLPLQGRVSKRCGNRPLHLRSPRPVPKRGCLLTPTAPEHRWANSAAASTAARWWICSFARRCRAAPGSSWWPGVLRGSSPNRC